MGRQHVVTNENMFWNQSDLGSSLAVLTVGMELLKSSDFPLVKKKKKQDSDWITESVQ